MLIDWLVVAAIVGVSGYFAVRSIMQTLRGKKACCEAGAQGGCQLADLMQKNNLPHPRTCNGLPVTDPDRAFELGRRGKG
ncbi:hypothetical protein LLH00_06865 [bacterium]|nr:hypothetical protein [bacterium]